MQQMSAPMIYKEQYQKEQDQLLQTILDLRFFNPWKGLTKYQDRRSLQPDSHLELYVTSSCDQHCEYCYLQKHKELYPAEFNKPELILENLERVCRWILINNFNIPILDLFSGDIWGTQLGWDIFDTLYKYIQQGMQIGYIMIASNCNFVSNSIALQRVQQYINKFKNINCPIVFSVSVDGKVIDDFSRPKNSKETYTDEFYNTLGAFAHTNNFLFHPMISPYNVHLWIENYKWWKEYLKYYNYKDISAIMTLEVRDANWTEENIKDYCNLLIYMMDDFLQDKCHGDINKFTHAIIGTKVSDMSTYLTGYIPWAMIPADSFKGCTVPSYLTIRLGDLAICPCHRQAYKQYLYGYFNVENDNITTIRAVNPTMAIKILMADVQMTTPLCYSCIFKKWCLKGCFGSQLETMHDPFFPINSVCKFFKAKYKTIMNYYKEKGVIKILQDTYKVSDLSADKVIDILLLNDKLEELKDDVGTSIE